MPIQFTKPTKINNTCENWKGILKNLTFFLANMIMYVENTEELPLNYYKEGISKCA